MDLHASGIQLLARGPWDPTAITTTWRDDHYEPDADAARAADDRIAALRDRGSPSHDGIAGRLVDFTVSDAGLALELQPIRWALRLIEDNAHGSMAALCVTRHTDGRWLAGRRAAWLSTWAGRWALGAGGAVDPGESPGHTLVRELDEEWGLTPSHVRGEALLRLPSGMVMFIGHAWVDEEHPVMDDEHDAFAWWPADPDAWPPEADEPLRRMARLFV